MTVAPGPVLVVGMPRSGTTWTGNVLGLAAGRTVVHEPDNEKEHLSAYAAKRGLGRFPVLDPTDEAPAYERLWQLSLAGVDADTATARARLGRRLWLREEAPARERAVLGSPSRATQLAAKVAGSADASPVRLDRTVPVVVKTVHAALALEWLTHRFVDLSVVLVLRHPANVLSSWLEMNLPDQDRRLDEHPAVQRDYLARWGVPSPAPGASAVDRAAWQVCLLTAALVDTRARHPEWLVVQHEELCAEPTTRFAALARSLGLGWTPHAESFVVASDQPGAGFTLQRRAQDQPERWRSRLGADGIAALRSTAALFPGLQQWQDDLVEAAESRPVSPAPHDAR